ncbi:hypothetical protein MMB68_25585 [Priestia sp. Y58]|uniref:hypothetical protein n=1 Tax=Priestia sp. Y58 TaxID=2922804 RepID=UPI002405BB82|nr:hypothetical protein [Priestia sp. Y58]MDG0032913.1 hypothetical protein [Priestia sp. Y58]
MGNAINFTQGRRGTIACVDNTIATLVDGTAQAIGNLLDGDFTVDFPYTINPITDEATIVIMATGEYSTVFQTTFTAPISPQTFIGGCDTKLLDHNEKLKRNIFNTLREYIQLEVSLYCI